ncbi:glycosyltransferase family 4 protein [Candidatus Merdisoma sp. JLR.KK006]|uniref:glycosyltransferase family 4 protein n=1 Tax=Candidatus Merdisoma sp. JLR.KK006 TaxID=3112626 RepID=UPI002FF2FEDF
MKILHIMHDYKPRIGGSVVRNANMVEAYKRNSNDEIYLINLGGKEYKLRECIGGIKIYRCRSLMEMIVTARNIIFKNGIEILHAHNYRFMFVAFMIKFMCPWRHLKIVTEMHSLYRMKRFKELISYYLLRKSDAVIVLADSAKQYLAEKMRVDKKKITSISNGISEVSFKENKNFKLYEDLSEKKNNYCIAAYFGTFYAWQGVLFLAQNIEKIFQECPDLYLVMIGDGPDFVQTKELIQKSRYKEQIFLSGSIEKEQICNLYELVDIILIPRLRDLSTDTAIPLKAVEAMEFSKCILAGKDNGLREILNEKNAGLFKSGDIEDFIFVLKKLLADRQLRGELGQKAKMDSRNFFHTWDTNALQVKKIYEKIQKINR